ncbi:Calmodulin binding protein-like protein [Cynara cardunculus var. scolymus]|uniref:Calmodulin binding protein-like protein n=1 Tax=Cynara cardunculus var. scolymus TaxID=59895 RepID=A0A103U5R7_CYNCS|nr:Calmodulin binding protein-like protein [Cynara cardunculus var. scolymus]
MTKRFADNPESDQCWQNERRQRTRPSLASAIGEVVKMNFVQNFCTALEPMLRRVVNEEVDNGLRRRIPSYARSNSLLIKALGPSTMQLKFRKLLTLPIFTGTKIVDEDGNPLEIYLVDINNNQESIISCAIKLQIVVVDGDFPSANSNIWTSDEFEKNIVKERRGKRPLLAGDVSVTMRDGVVTVGDIELTDNSSWIRSRKFRIGARVVQGETPGIVIREAMTDAFVVKDHRGELYKKHHPPMLQDDVWRLEKIGKDGAFHKKLTSNGIKTVQDFLKLSVVNEPKLRKILGLGMPDKMWEATLKHARTCVPENKFYISRGPNHTIYLNPICQVVKAVINGDTFFGKDLSSVNRKWNSLEVVDGVMNETPLLTQGDMAYQYPHNNTMTMAMYEGQVFPAGQTTELAFVSNKDYVGVVGSTYFLAPTEAYNFAESSSEGEFGATYNFIK